MNGVSQFILDKIFGKKKSSEPLNIKITELDSWLTDETANFTDTFSKDVKKTLTNIENTANQLRDYVEEFGKLEISEDLLPQIRRVAVSNREAFIKRITGLVAELKIPSTTEFEEVDQFHKSVMPVLNKTRERIRKHLRYFRGVSKHGILEKTLKEVEMLKLHLEDLGTKLEDNKNTLTAIKKSRTIMDRIKQLRNNLKDGETPLRLKEELNRVKDELQETERKIENLTEKAEWEKYINHLKMEEKLKNDLKTVRVDISRVISPLNKSFKKFGKLVDKEQDIFDKRSTLELYISSPIEALEKDTELEGLNLILKLIKTCIENGRLELKSGKQEKTLTQIRNIQESDRLRELAIKLRDLKQELKNLESELSEMKVQEERNILNEKRGETERKIRDLTSQIEEVATSKKEYANQISELNASLEESLTNLTGREVKIQETDQTTETP